MKVNPLGRCHLCNGKSTFSEAVPCLPDALSFMELEGGFLIWRSAILTCCAIYGMKRTQEKVAWKELESVQLLGGKEWAFGLPLMARLYGV